MSPWIAWPANNTPWTARARQQVRGSGARDARAVVDQRSAVESISAVTLVVSDMTAAVAFYEALEFEVRYGGPDAAFTSFGVGDNYLNLSATSHPPGPPGWGRVIFYVDDVDEMYDRALGAGLEASTKPRNGSWGERFFHISDPDGHELSFARPIATTDD